MLGIHDGNAVTNISEYCGVNLKIHVDIDKNQTLSPYHDVWAGH